MAEALIVSENNERAARVTLSMHKSLITLLYYFDTARAIIHNSIVPRFRLPFMTCS